MKSRALRFALHAVFVATVAAAAYVVWKLESEGAAAANTSRAFAERAGTISRTLIELKAAQSGYVAAGQGEDYWVSRVDTLAGAAREGLASLAPFSQRPQSQSEIDAAAAALEDFEQMDRRARDYVRGGQRLLASDLIFSDGIEKMDAAIAAIERARSAESASAAAGAAGTRRSQLTAAGVAAIAGLLIVFVLVPLPRPEPAVGTIAAPAREAVEPPAAARKLAPPAPSPAVAAPAAARAAHRANQPAIDLAGMASLCTDLARVLDTRALPAALERTARLLDASGLVIWVADPDGKELLPVVAHGYPQNLVSRLGSIPRDAENATAAAFRTGVLQTVKADTISHGAIAAPLLTASGPVGVMAAEVRNDGERRDATRAAAAIVAAQLATLVGPPPTRAQAKSEAV